MRIVRNKRWTWMVVVMVMISIGAMLPAPSAHAVQYPALTSLTFWRNGSKIYATYCGVADRHSLTVAKYKPNSAVTEWSTDYEYGAMNGCWTAYLYNNVPGGDKLWTGLYIYGSADPGDGGYGWIVVNLNPSGTTNLGCQVQSPHSWLAYHMKTSESTATSCTFRW